MGHRINPPLGTSAPGLQLEALPLKAQQLLLLSPKTLEQHSAYYGIAQFVQGVLPLWMVETFAGPLLPHEAAPIYNSHPSNTQAMDLEKALLDIPVREHSRFVTTAIPLCQAHNHPIIERLLAAQTFPQAVLQRPVSPEADAILSLPPRLRKLIISKILHRFATVGAKDALQVDCPGLGSDSLDLLPNPDITVCCLAVGNTQVYGPTLTPIDMPTHNGHVVAYGDTSGIHEMTVALL